jgi:hemolysin activation/secretion protein
VEWGSGLSERKTSRGPRSGRRGVAFLSLSAGCWIALSAIAASAQADPRPPTREEVRGPVQPEQRRPRATLSVDDDLARIPCALADERFADIRFTPTSVTFEDLRGLPPEALRPAYAPYLGREQPIAALCEIRDRAAAILRQAGYVAAVEIPEQRVEDGNVRFQVLTARLVAIRVRGDAGRNERMIARYLEHLLGREAFNRYEAERYLLLAGDMPGTNIRLALRSAGAARGEVVGEVTVVRIPGLVDASVQNFGSRELGRWGALLRGQVFGITGLGDRTTLALFSTPDFEEQKTVQLGHDFRLGSEGFALSGQLTYAWAHPDLGDPAIDVEARTLLATLEASYPFVRRQSHSIRGAAGLDLIDQEVDFNGLALSRERLRVAFGRIDVEAGEIGDVRSYSALEPRWRATASLELRQGLGILGASDGCGPLLGACAAAGVPPSRLEGDPTATVVRAEARAEVRPIPAVTAVFGASAQYSARPLFAFEEYAAGNYTVGRGYDPGTLLGDSGIGFQAELRFGRGAPRTPDGFAVQPYVFYDHAWVWNEDRVQLLSTSDRLSSVGAGVRGAWGDRARLDLVVAVPLNRAGIQTERPDPRILVSFTTRLWPWSLR